MLTFHGDLMAELKQKVSLWAAFAQSGTIERKVLTI